MAQVDNPVTVELSADSIYAHALIRFVASAQNHFAIRIKDAEQVDIGRGVSRADYVEADEADGRHRIELRILGWIRERPVADPDRQGAAHTYGMRYYPFVSSKLVGRVEIDGGSLEHVVVDLPDRFRLIWFAQAAIAGPGEGKRAELRHSFGEQRSQFVLTWTSDQLRTTASLDVPLRLGAAALGELVLFPALYLTLSLLGIALAALAASVSIVVAAIGTTWTFALRQWSGARLPQQSTLLTAGYLIAALFVLIWGVAWEALGWPAAALALPLLATLWYLRRAVGQFRGNGTLPRRLTRPWATYTTWREAKDQESALI